MLQNKHILVTGGAGYIGSQTAKALSRAGYTPVTYDNLVNGHRWAVRWGPFVEADLDDRTALKRVFAEFPIEGVVHFAAFAYVGESVAEPAKYFANNAANTLALLDEMREAGVGRIVFSSTCATYGNPDHLPIDESHVQKPVNPYGESKLFVERVLHWYAQAYGLRYAALRYFNAAGADPEGEIGEDHDPETHLIPLAIEAAMGRRDPLKVYGSDYPTPDGTAIRDYVHVADLASAHVAAIDRLLGGGDSLHANLGTGRGVSVMELIHSVDRVGGIPVPFAFGPRRAGDPPILVADASRAKVELGWAPRFSDLDTIVRTAWDWHERHASNADMERSVRMR